MQVHVIHQPVEIHVLGLRLRNPLGVACTTYSISACGRYYFREKIPAVAYFFITVTNLYVAVRFVKTGPWYTWPPDDCTGTNITLYRVARFQAEF